MAKIEEMYAFVSYDKGDPNDEGIMGFKTENGWLPMVGADMDRIDSLRILANDAARATGMPYKILKFKLSEVVEVNL